MSRSAPIAAAAPQPDPSGDDPLAVVEPDWSRWTNDGWPEQPDDVFKTRDPWSPFNKVSRKPILR